MVELDKKPTHYSYILFVLIAAYMFVEHFIITMMVVLAFVIGYVKDKIKSKYEVPQWIHSASVEAIRESERRSNYGNRS